MARTIKKVRYFYVDVSNRPGQGAKLLDMLKAERINLLALTGFPKGSKAQIDFMPADVPAFRAAARRAKLKLKGPKIGFLARGVDRVGAVADIMAKLAKAKINVTAIDAVSAGAGRFGAIFWVKARDVNRAARLLRAS